MNLSRNVRVKVDQGGKGWRFRCVVIAKVKGEEGESRRRAEVEVARIPADDIDRKNKGRLGKAMSCWTGSTDCWSDLSDQRPSRRRRWFVKVKDDYQRPTRLDPNPFPLEGDATFSQPTTTNQPRPFPSVRSQIQMPPLLVPPTSLTPTAQTRSQTRPKLRDTREPFRGVTWGAPPSGPFTMPPMLADDAGG